MIRRDWSALVAVVGARRLAAIVVGCAALGALTSSLTVAWLTQPPKEGMP